MTYFLLAKSQKFKFECSCKNNIFISLCSTLFMLTNENSKLCWHTPAKDQHCSLNPFLVFSDISSNIPSRTRSRCSCQSLHVMVYYSQNLNLLACDCGISSTIDSPRPVWLLCKSHCCCGMESICVKSFRWFCCISLKVPLLFGSYVWWGEHEVNKWRSREEMREECGFEAYGLASFACVPLSSILRQFVWEMEL